MNPEHPAVKAIAASGLTLAHICKQARVCPGYLRQLLRNGAPYDTAERLAAVIGCRMEVFQRPTGRRENAPGGDRGAAAASRHGRRSRRKQA